jgi:hypothetical protein
VTRLRSGLAAVLDVIATLPFAVAGTVLAIGFVVSFNTGWLILTGGPFIMGAGLHGAQNPVRGALLQRHSAPDRSFAGGSLDQPRPLALADLRAHPSAFDAWAAS